MLLTYAREGAWITWAVLKVVALRIWDRFLRLFVGGIPLHAAQLEHAATLNALLGRSDVFAVAADDEKRRKSDEAALGAGGSGTSRAWLTVDLNPGGLLRLFCKLPAATAFESIFLEVFGVYAFDRAATIFGVCM